VCYANEVVAISSRNDSYLNTGQPYYYCLQHNNRNDSDSVSNNNNKYYILYGIITPILYTIFVSIDGKNK